MNKEEIKQILLQNNLIVKKKYGQNFLLDEVVLNNIILKAGIKADSCVVEIGPGLGFLTKKLSQFAGKVLCYEIDEQMVRFLKKENYNNVEIIQDDFLNRNLDEDFLKFNRNIFSQRRKTLINNLQKTYHYTKSEIEEILYHFHISVSIRAEELSVNQIIDLANAFYKHFEQNKRTN